MNRYDSQDFENTIFSKMKRRKFILSSDFGFGRIMVNMLTICAMPCESFLCQKEQERKKSMLCDGAVCTSPLHVTGEILYKSLFFKSLASHYSSAESDGKHFSQFSRGVVHTCFHAQIMLQKSCSMGQGKRSDSISSYVDKSTSRINE